MRFPLRTSRCICQFTSGTWRIAKKLNSGLVLVGGTVGASLRWRITGCGMFGQEEQVVRRAKAPHKRHGSGDSIWTPPMQYSKPSFGSQIILGCCNIPANNCLRRLENGENQFLCKSCRVVLYQTDYMNCQKTRMLHGAAESTDARHN